MFKGLHIWLPDYIFQRSERRIAAPGPTDIMLAVCDHFEPLHGADKTEAILRVNRWLGEYPKLIAPFRDHDGQLPRHTFFYPVEQHDPDIVKTLADVCNACKSEVEVHLHHENDTAESLRGKLMTGIEALAKDGFLSLDSTGNVRYGFIHGNWALDNSNPKGRFCGVSTELGVLRETGCYGDFTLPAAPDPAQTRTINSLYYAQDTPEPKSHDCGRRVCVGTTRSENKQELLIIQGPLGLNWKRRKFGFFPRIENSDLTGVNPPTPDRMDIWMRLGIHVERQPNWVFIKLHTHGGIPRNMATLLGDPMRRFFDNLVTRFNDGNRYRLHFVSAREMVNIIHAAEAGERGNAGQFRNYRYHLRSQPGHFGVR